MGSLVQFFYEWEIQMLVLLSFNLQMFLLCVGSLRRRSNNMFLRSFTWIAYLGADLVAVYALGYISRHDDATTGKDRARGTLPLAFFWAPFLLIHLGGPDTITAFAIEDNNLWLRHLLNLVVQVILALYVFWKSIGWHSMKLLVPGGFVFLAGIIKYGERSWSLMLGSVNSIRTRPSKKTKDEASKLPQDHTTTIEQWLPQVTSRNTGYSNIVSGALCSMLGVQYIFAGRAYYRWKNQPGTDGSPARPVLDAEENKKMAKMMEIQLGMMYDDLYTKALVLRTRSGIILRCISQISSVIAFVLFFVSNKQRYSRADIAITYVLFIGGFLLEVLAVFMMVVISPWTWVWLKARKCHRLARMIWLLLSSKLGWPEKRPLWSNSMGQYNLVSSVAAHDHEKPRSCNQLLRMMIGKMMTLLGARKGHASTASKLLETHYVKVDKETLECVLMGVSRLNDEINKKGSGSLTLPRHWPKLDQLLRKQRYLFGDDFGTWVVNMHVLTEVNLSKCHSHPHHHHLEDVCRKLSNYMIHLLVSQPSMLPLYASVEATLELWKKTLEKVKIGEKQDKGAILTAYENVIKQQMDDERNEPQHSETSGEEMLEEIKDAWIGLLLYAAGKSKPEKHAEQLGEGGELLTFAWLLLAHFGLGDSGGTKIELFMDLDGHQAYIFHLPSRRSPKE